jgi:hypothetical protein
MPKSPWSTLGSTQVSRLFNAISIENNEKLISSTLGKFTKALVQAAPGKNLLGFGSMMGFKEFAAIWGRVHGVKCSFQQSDRKSIEAAIPGGVGEMIMDMFDFIAEFGFDGGDPSVVHPKDVCCAFSASRVSHS